MECTLENAFITVPFPIITFEGIELKITYANNALLELWGKDQSILGKTFQEVLPELQDQTFPDLLKRVFKTGVTHTDTEASVTFERNGQRVHVYFDYSYSAIRNDQQTITGVLVICRDVTQQVLAKKMAEESEAQFRLTVLQAPVAMAIIKVPEFIIETANQESIKLWGRTNEMIGKRVSDVFPEATEQGFTDILKSVYNSAKPYYGNEVPVELVIDGERNQVYINFVFQPIFQNNLISSIITVGYDVTDLVRSRKKAEESEAEAIDAKNSLEIALNKKDEFISLASHELKTPLTSIMGYLQVLERTQTEGKNKLFVSKTVQQVKKLNDLVSNLLDVSKIESGKLQLLKEPFNIREVLEDSIDLIKHAYITQEIQFESNVDSILVPIDRNRIEQVMINLLINAIKYSPDNGKVSIRTLKMGNTVRIEIEDQEA